jgi:hypothetical protein
VQLIVPSRQRRRLLEDGPVAPRVDEDCGRDAERHHVRDGVELNPYLGRGLRETRYPPVQRVEENGPAYRARGAVEVSRRAFELAAGSPAA